VHDAVEFLVKMVSHFVTIFEQCLLLFCAPPSRFFMERRVSETFDIVYVAGEI